MLFWAVVEEVRRASERRVSDPEVVLVLDLVVLLVVRLMVCLLSISFMSWCLDVGIRISTEKGNRQIGTNHNEVHCMVKEKKLVVRNFIIV